MINIISKAFKILKISFCILGLIMIIGGCIIEPQNFSEEKFNQLYPYLATFYLKRYSRTLPRSKNYEIALFVDYTVNKTNYHISGINYDRDLFYEAFHLMAKDLKPSENDTRAISILNR